MAGLPPAIVDDASAHEQAVRELCSKVFADPSLLVQTLTHQISDTFTIREHVHDDVMQFDLLVGCGGTVWSEGNAIAIEGNTAMVSPPGCEHGYELFPGDQTSRVYHFKLRVAEDWQIIREAQAEFPRVVTGLGTVEALAAAMRSMTRLGLIEHLRPILLIARLAEVLCLWPTDQGDARPIAGDEGGRDDSDVDQRMAAAFELIERRLSNPPSLDELARAAHFSPRHFARRFRRLYGCTPHTYITARRFALARQSLTQQRLSVTQIARSLGFGSVATFSRWFTQQAGASPSQYREDPTVM